MPVRRALFMPAAVWAASTAVRRLHLLKAMQRGAAVVRSTRVSEGRVLAANPKWDEAGFISGGNLNPQKARILLQLALTCTHEPRKIQEIFLINIKKEGFISGFIGTDFAGKRQVYSRIA